MTSEDRPRSETAAVRVDPDAVSSPAGEDATATHGAVGRVEGEAVAAEARDRTAQTTVRRAEEQSAKAHEQAEQAREAEEAAERAEAEAREEEERARREAEDARRRAEESGGGAPVTSTRTNVPVAQQGQPIVFGPFTAEKPELLLAAAFVGGLLLGRILKVVTS